MLTIGLIFPVNARHLLVAARRLSSKDRYYIQLNGGTPDIVQVCRFFRAIFTLLFVIRHAVVHRKVFLRCARTVMQQAAVRIAGQRQYI